MDGELPHRGHISQHERDTRWGLQRSEPNKEYEPKMPTILLLLG